MKNVIVISPREPINYNLVFPAVIRALDYIKDEKEPVRYYIDNVSGGTSALVMEAVNKMEASLMARGYDVKASHRNIDVMRYGKNALLEWAKKHLPDANVVLIFDVGPNKAAAEAKAYAKEHNIPVVEVKTEAVESKRKRKIR